MAYIRKLPSGNYNAVVRLANGKRKSITDPLKRVVEQRAREVEVARDRGDALHLRSRRVTVAAWHQKWLDARSVEDSTARKDDGRWRNHVAPHWGSWPLESISRLDVQTWIKDLSKARVGPDAVHGSYQLLAVILSDAVDHGLIAASPCRKITLPRKGRPEPRWLTRHEYDRLQLALAAKTTTLGGRRRAPDPHAPVWQAFVGLGCFSGLRPGEIAGLDVGHIDLARRLVRVTQVLTRLEEPDGGHRYGIRDYPKSDRSRRSVPFPAEVADLLWRILADRTSGPAFTAPRGGRVMVESNFATQVWRPALRDAGIAPVRPYVMRHTAASWLVQAGVSDRRIMQILGHANTHLIELYAHLAPDAHDEIRAAWGDTDETWRHMGDPRGLSEARLGDETAGQMWALD